MEARWRGEGGFLERFERMRNRPKSQHLVSILSFMYQKEGVLPCPCFHSKEQFQSHPHCGNDACGQRWLEEDGGGPIGVAASRSVSTK